MATSARNERDIILSQRSGDPERVQAVLADWGLDQATINRMLSYGSAKETGWRPAAAPSTPVTHPHDQNVNGRRSIAYMLRP